MNTQNENRPCGENCPRKQNTITVPLSPMEKDLLSRLAVTPFLPVASDGYFPVCRELELPSPQAGNLLQKLQQPCLWKASPMRGMTIIPSTAAWR